MRQRTILGNKFLCPGAPLREKFGVQARFLLGPAGSGKTFRCLAEICTALQKNPEGPPLILLAPKQATFQLERQLLANAGLSGYTRLRVFSFDRLARFVLDELSVLAPAQLNDEGRVMVLRALLHRHERELTVFRQSALRPGFAQHLGGLLAELQQHRFSPVKLRQVAARLNEHHELRDKLQDLALLANAYARWLQEQGLQDNDGFLVVAAEALRTQSKIQNSKFNIERLWLDGFAEMTPQELDLLAAVLPFCECASLAFCLETEPDGAGSSWLSLWSAIAKTYEQCRQRLEQLPDCQISVELMKRDARENRFAPNSALRHLEQNWSDVARGKSNQLAIGDRQSAISLAVCAHTEAEAIFAAREILKFVRRVNRFRDAAVLVRHLDDYQKPLERAFRRYEIPFFLDQRESIAHHPLAELTRSALRTAAFDWPHDDWFAALKAGFSPADETEIDRLENAALEFGWHGRKWLTTISIPQNPELEKFVERLRRKLLPPFENLAKRLTEQELRPTGTQLAAALRELWDDLRVEATLEKWDLSHPENASRISLRASLHSTVFGQMNSWLDNFALAFSHEALPLRDWLPILEAGLSNLTVGAVPPALDQVLIGAVDRARNPDLKLALVLGANEGIFPAAPAVLPILTHADREELEQHNVALGPNLRDELAREQYFGYVACTRASERLVVTFSRHGTDGKPRNPSPFIAHFQKVFPALEIEEFSGQPDWRDAESANELAPLLAEAQNSKFKIQNLLEIPALQSLAGKLAALREPDPAETLSPALAEKLYGPVLQTSVSRLEEFAQCPFRFFVHSGLRAEERKVFELDARERGDFQHEVLRIFHEQLTAEKKRWRDLAPAEARERVGQIAANLASRYRDGLLRGDDRSRFAARVLAESLQDFVETLVTWMRGQYEFDPVAAELEFGLEGGAPAWELDLGNGRRLALRGRIDRVDLCRQGDGALVVVDYKSSVKKLDALLMEHGVQLQLVSYLNVLQRWKNPRELFGSQNPVPAGVFYVNLRGHFENGKTRDEILEDSNARKLAYRHTGRFDAGALPKLDRVGAADQFNYRLNQDGSLRKGATEALPRAEFEALLDRVETQLTEMGRAIFAGEAKVDPYRKGTETACRFCDYRAVCRIDPWTHRYRVLRTMKEGHP